MTSRPAWRDYIAYEELPDGTRVALGSIHAKVGHAYEVAAAFWPEPFAAGRGRIDVDRKGRALDEPRTAVEVAHG